jgi:hypothetical protein
MKIWKYKVAATIYGLFNLSLAFVAFDGLKNVALQTIFGAAFAVVAVLWLVSMYKNQIRKLLFYPTLAEVAAFALLMVYLLNNTFQGRDSFTGVIQNGVPLLGIVFLAIMIFGVYSIIIGALAYASWIVRPTSQLIKNTYDQTVVLSGENQGVYKSIRGLAIAGTLLGIMGLIILLLASFDSSSGVDKAFVIIAGIPLLLLSVLNIIIRKNINNALNDKGIVALLSAINTFLLIGLIPGIIGFITVSKINKIQKEIGSSATGGVGIK